MNAATELQFHPLGDAAIIVEVGAQEAASATFIDEVLQAQQLLEEAKIPGVTEITTAFASVALFYDPSRVRQTDNVTIFDSLEAQIREVLVNRVEQKATPDAQQQTTHVPVCYDPEFALDLDNVAQQAGLSPEEVVRLHGSAEYRVGCVGFTPGFPYLVGLPAELATPRRASPRTAVPAGSIAIGGSQAGIYPVQSPGGWHVIGRTALRLFDPARETPSLLRAGDRVRFRQISREEFDRAVASAPSRSVQPSVNK